MVAGRRCDCPGVFACICMRVCPRVWLACLCASFLGCCVGRLVLVRPRAVGPQAAPRLERRAAETDCQYARTSRAHMRRLRAGPRLCRVADAQGVPLECRGRHAQHARRVHGCHDQDHMPPVLSPGAHSSPSPRADCRSRPTARVHSQSCCASFTLLTCRALEMAAGPVWGR
jgi:hypothetical protein